MLNQHNEHRTSTRNSSTPISRRANLLCVTWQEEITRFNRSVRVPLTLHQLNINTHKTPIIPSPIAIPRIPLRDLLLTQRSRFLAIRRSNIPSKCSHRGAEPKPDSRVIPRRVPAQFEVPRLRVIGKPVVAVAEGDGICYNVVCRTDVRIVAAAQLEAVAVAFERAKVPSILLLERNS